MPERKPLILRGRLSRLGPGPSINTPQLVARTFKEEAAEVASMLKRAGTRAGNVAEGLGRVGRGLGKSFGAAGLYFTIKDALEQKRMREQQRKRFLYPET